MSDSVECPWCRARITDLWDFGWKPHDDDTVETECELCNGPIVLSRTVTIEYGVTKALRDEGGAR